MFVVGILLLVLFIACDDDGPVGPGDPAKIVAINGLYYKADSLTQKPLLFAVADKNNNYLPNQQILLSVIDGDGALSPDTIITDSTGTASFTYTFIDSLGHAVIRLTAPDVDTIDILIRRSTLIPGPGGQGQYILFDDTYADVKRFNGPPASVDIDPDYWINYANYESTLGVVVIIEDANQDSSAADWEEVKGVIVNTNNYTTYLGTTAEGIGVGSSIDDLRAVYGEPDEINYDPDPPPAVEIRYKSLGLRLFGDFSADTTIFEIQLSELVLTSTTAAVGHKPKRIYNKRSNTLSGY